MKGHICSEFDMAWNPHTESLVCVDCGKDFGKWPFQQYLMQKRNSTTGICFAKLSSDITLTARVRECSRQQAYAEYAALFFYDDYQTSGNKPITQSEGKTE